MSNESTVMLQRRLKELEIEIEDTIKRLPAHSTKPPVMMDLLALEDERDALVARLKENKQGAP